MRSSYSLSKYALLLAEHICNRIFGTEYGQPDIYERH